MTTWDRRCLPAAADPEPQRHGHFCAVVREREGEGTERRGKGRGFLGGGSFLATFKNGETKTGARKVLNVLMFWFPNPPPKKPRGRERKGREAEGKRSLIALESFLANKSGRKIASHLKKGHQSTPTQTPLTCTSLTVL